MAPKTVGICLRNGHVSSELNPTDPERCYFCSEPVNIVPLTSAAGILATTPEQRAELARNGL